MYALEERPMSVFQVIKHSANFWIKTLLTILPLTILYSLLMAYVDYLATVSPEQFPHPTLKALIPFIVMLLGAILLVAIFSKMNSELTEKPLGLWAAVKLGSTRLISVIYWYVLIIFILGAPTALLIVIGHFLAAPLNIFVYLIIPLFLIIVAVYLFVSFPLMATENVSPLSSIKQSFQLVKKQWWHTFGIFLLSFIIVIGGELLLYKIFMLHKAIAVFIIMTFFTSFACGISLIQLRHLRAYHKFKDPKI